MADQRTEITELATALGTLGRDTLTEAVEHGVRTGALANVEPSRLHALHDRAVAGAHEALASAAFANGRAFLGARDGLRGRPPVRIEWTGARRPPGYDLLPADLRIDHVYLVSCKYQSRLLMNASPAHVFDRLLAVRTGPQGEPVVDWYSSVAACEYAELYEAVRRELHWASLPHSADRLTAEDRRLIAKHCQRRWPKAVQASYERMCAAVSDVTARRWSASMPALREREQVLWRLLRLADSPYFVLGSSGNRVLRLRIGTPWDWRQRYRLRSFDVSPSPARQPRVGWHAAVLDMASGDERTVRGHVEVRWSHGRFCGMPEAKVYLDTPHEHVPGYFPLEGVQELALASSAGARRLVRGTGGSGSTDGTGGTGGSGVTGGSGGTARLVAASQGRATVPARVATLPFGHIEVAHPGGTREGEGTWT